MTLLALPILAARHVWLRVHVAFCRDCRNARRMMRAAEELIVSLEKLLGERHPDVRELKTIRQRILDAHTNGQVQRLMAEMQATATRIADRHDPEHAEPGVT